MYHNTTIYQIYPRSFCDSNNDGIGDIRGIISKLDYISELGFETIWVSPFFSSPQRDFGYDISNYRTIHPEYGTMEDVEFLISEVHRRGMKILLDMVMNHTSDTHEWFKDSIAKANGKENWYIWRKGRGTHPPNNWINIIGKPAWNYVAERHEWYMSSFMNYQPDLNYRHQAVHDEMLDTVKFWLDKGVDGFRLDIFNCIYKDPDFRDNPFSLNPLPSEKNPGGRFQFKKYNVNHPDSYGFARTLRAVTESYSHRLLLGEVMGSHKAIRPFIAEDKGLHLIFLFDMVFFKFSAKWFAKKLEEYEREYPAPLMPTCVFSNHDQWRSMRRLKNDKAKAKLLAILQYTMRAVPITYYGEEIGIANANIPLSEAKDSLSLLFSWIPQWLVDRLPVALNRDNCRTPMHWDNSTNAGFTATASPWLPLTNVQDANVESQQVQGSLLSIYRRLLLLRKQYPSLRLGSISDIATKDNVLYYIRQYEQETLKVILNFSNRQQRISSLEGNVILQIGYESGIMSAYGAVIMKM
jgi:oligo-1,6-glucosidase/alpha-glucosidase